VFGNLEEICGIRNYREFWEIRKIRKLGENTKKGEK
jgi:hypothetical protein